MSKKFNTNGICYPDRHYMAALGGRLEIIKNMIEGGNYFVISRARQYGKTTLLHALKDYLGDRYYVVFLSFQQLSASDFETEYAFTSAFADIFLESLPDKAKSGQPVAEALRPLEQLADEPSAAVGLRRLFKYLSRFCEASEKSVVLIIDEVDSASNNQIFIDFLAQLRVYYLNREAAAIFQSVILAGVYDIKNLKYKIRPDESRRYNSPWNIAADFTADMNFSIQEIAGMLSDYKQERGAAMDLTSTASEIYAYTCGYPFLVSRICQIVDEQLCPDIWSKECITAAAQILLREHNTLFDDMIKNLETYGQLRKLLCNILFQGITFPYSPDYFITELGRSFGFLKVQHDAVVIANRIFETRLYNLFLTDDMIKNSTYRCAVQNKNQFIQNGMLDMECVLRCFVTHFTDIYAGSSEKFLEENGRRLFLLYLKPIINGTGNYYVEARTRTMSRTDVIVDYLGKQYIIEMKIWRGEEYNRRGREQLAGYLNDYHADVGYMLSFNFNKHKTIGVKRIQWKDKMLIEAVV